MQDAFTALNILYLQLAHFLPAQAVIKQGGKNSAIPLALERVRRRGIQQLARLGVRERRRRAFVTIGHWTIDPVDGIMRDRVLFAQMVKE